MVLFGSDFIAAKRLWLYPDQPLQWVARAVALFVLLFVAYQVLQGVFATVIFSWALHGGLTGLTNPGSTDFNQFIKALMLSIFPSAIIIAALTIYLARFGMAGQMGRLPVGRPNLGLLGWLVVVFGFLVFSFIVYQAVFAAMGVDPATYVPSSDGLSDKNTAAGMVEKAMADMASDPKLFTFVTLSAVIGAPLVEELLFRGALFAAIAQSPFGRWGAVVITSALFGLAHAMTDGWPVVIVLFLMGITLSLLLLRFGSLWVTIACHASWNAVQALALLSIGTHS